MFLLLTLNMLLPAGKATAWSHDTAQKMKFSIKDFFIFCALWNFEIRTENMPSNNINKMFALIFIFSVRGIAQIFYG